MKLFCSSDLQKLSCFESSLRLHQRMCSSFMCSCLSCVTCLLSRICHLFDPFEQVNRTLATFLLIPSSLFISKSGLSLHFSCYLWVVLFGAEAPPGAVFCNVQRSTIKRNWIAFQLSDKANSREIQEIIIENHIKYFFICIFSY